MRKKILSLLLAAVLLLLPACGEQPTPTPTPGPTPGPKVDPLPPLRCVVFSIGKADASLLYGDGFAVLIDAGESEDVQEILTYLKVKQITRLDALIVTHFDKDHVGGAAGILDSIPVSAVYTTYRVKESDEIAAFDAAMIRAGLTETVVKNTLSLSFGEHMTMTVWPPESTDYKKDASNNSSLVTRVTYGDCALLFAADAQEARVAELLDGRDLSADFLKVPYHGNDVSNLPALLAAVKPAYAAVTCSDKNPEETGKAAALSAAKAETFLTRAGNVYVWCDGLTLTAAYREK